VFVLVLSFMNRSITVFSVVLVSVSFFSVRMDGLDRSVPRYHCGYLEWAWVDKRRGTEQK